MEAIYPTSAAPIDECHQYEIVTPPEGEYSYAQVRGYHQQGVKELKALYEEPDIKPLVPTPQQTHQPREKSPLFPRKRKPTEPSAVVHEDQETKSMTGTDMYEVMLPRLPRSPQRNVPVPPKLSHSSELPTHDLSLSQSEVQLWNLNQLQKLVLREEGVSPSEATKGGKQSSQFFIGKYPCMHNRSLQ